MAPALLETSKKVCVMDASGCLGSGLVDRLLQQGYSVHAAVGSRSKIDSLKAKNQIRLRVYEADPLDYRSVMAALKGCSALFYSFEPAPGHGVVFDEYSVEEEVRGAHNVIEACAQTDTIEKVVFTSSVAAVIWGEGLETDQDFDEKSWSDVNFCRNYKLWYALSKTLAEKTAWALAMDRDVHMVSINAGLLLAPNLHIKSPYLKGAAEMYQHGVLATVDLQYLVEAHICIFEDISTYGRYLCFNHLINRPNDAVDFVKLLAPSTTSSVPLGAKDAGNFEQRISCNKLEKAMLESKN